MILLPSRAMRRCDFHYDLPSGLIAQHPLADRSAGRLLCLDACNGRIEDDLFCNLPSRLQRGDLLVFNDTRVMAARLLGTKASGGRVEVLVERVLGERRFLAHVRAAKAPKAGATLRLEEAFDAEVIARRDDLFELAVRSERTVMQLLDRYGRVPLPPYISREAEAQDRARYQTVYAQNTGAVAAPTAGLHFDKPLLARLGRIGVETAFVTLHVGAGTFQPVRTARIEEHRMHTERVVVTGQVCGKITETRKRRGRVIAVGTTVVRSLESAARGGEIMPYTGETDLFIYPGYAFRCVDAIITNFHLPESTLLMLVCAFGGYEHVMNAYRHAVAQGYRFFSYGDAMLVTRPATRGE